MFRVWGREVGSSVQVWGREVGVVFRSGEERWE